MRSFETFTILVYIIDGKKFSMWTQVIQTLDTSHPREKKLVWSLLPQSRSAMLRRVGTYLDVWHTIAKPLKMITFINQTKDKITSLSTFIWIKRTRTDFTSFSFAVSYSHFSIFLNVVSTTSSEVESGRACPLRKFAQHVASEVALC